MANDNAPSRRGMSRQRPHPHPVLAAMGLDENTNPMGFGSSTDRPVIGTWNHREDDTHYLRDDDLREALCGRVVIAGFGTWGLAFDGEPTCDECRKAWAER